MRPPLATNKEKAMRKYMMLAGALFILAAYGCGKEVQDDPSEMGKVEDATHDAAD